MKNIINNNQKKKKPPFWVESTILIKSKQESSLSMSKLTTQFVDAKLGFDSLVFLESSLSLCECVATAFTSHTAKVCIVISHHQELKVPN